MFYENQSPYHEHLISPNSPVQHFVTVDQHGNTIQKFSTQQYQQQQGPAMKGQHRYAPYMGDQRTNTNNNQMMDASPTYNAPHHSNTGIAYQQQNYCPSRTPPDMFSPGGGSDRSSSVPLTSPYMVQDPQSPSPMFNMENIGTVRNTMHLRPNSQTSVSSVSSPHHISGNMTSVSSEHNYVQGQEIHVQGVQTQTPTYNMAQQQQHQMLNVVPQQQAQQQPQQSQFVQPQYHTENDIKLMIIRKIAEQLEASARTFDQNPIVIPKVIIRSASIDSNDSMPELESLYEPYSIEDIMDVIEKDIQETRQMFPHRNLSTVVHHRPSSVQNVSGRPTQVIKIIKQQPKEKLIDFEALPIKPGRKSQSTQKRFQCIVCKKQFAGGSHLRNHFKTAVHRNEVLNTNQPDPVNLPDTWRIDDHVCTVCAQTFNKRECLLKHMALHNNDGVSQSQT